MRKILIALWRMATGTGALDLRVSVLSPKAGDTIIITSERALTPQQCAQIAEYVRKATPADVKAMVLHGGLSVAHIEASHDVMPQGAGYQPLAEECAATPSQTHAVDAYPGFAPVRVKYSHWLNPAPEHEGERILWSDGSAHGAPEDDSEFVTVLRPRAPKGQPKPYESIEREIASLRARVARLERGDRG